jgi:hypothetical protein
MLSTTTARRETCSQAKLLKSVNSADTMAEMRRNEQLLKLLAYDPPYFLQYASPADGNPAGNNPAASGAQSP